MAWGGPGWKEGSSLTALMLACLRWSLPNNAVLPPIEQDSPECARILIRAGANPLKQDLSGKTCLHHAILAGLPRIVKFLCEISEGPELVNLADVSGIRPFQLAADKFLDASTGPVVSGGGPASSAGTTAAPPEAPQPHAKGLPVSKARGGVVSKGIGDVGLPVAKGLGAGGGVSDTSAAPDVGGTPSGEAGDAGKPVTLGEAMRALQVVSCLGT